MLLDGANEETDDIRDMLIKSMEENNEAKDAHRELEIAIEICDICYRIEASNA